MTDHKFTDDDVIKGLEGLAAYDCKRCLDLGHDCFEKDCDKVIAENALALINRQKAEIERLETENKLLIENDVRNKYPNCVGVEKGRIYTRTLEDYDELIGDISAEAIKEFAERFKEIDVKTFEEYDKWGLTYVSEERIHNAIDTLVKEMTEEQTNESQST